MVADPDASAPPRLKALPPPPDLEGLDAPLTELGNAERFAREHCDEVRFVPQLGFFTWVGTHWVRDVDGECLRRMEQTIRAIPQNPPRELSEEEEKRLLRFARSSESKRGLFNALTLAEAELKLVCPGEKLDADPFALNCRNGTLHLAAGELDEHRPEALQTRLAEVDFHPDAQAPRWDRFLREVFSEDEDLIAFVQRAVGYSLTGSVREQCVFLLYGAGANGKALALDTPIPTPTGWTAQGELAPGDQVFDEVGHPCQVVGVTETWLDRPCYRIAFSDGSSVVADATHEWRVRARHGYHVTLTTKMIADNDVIARSRPDYGNEYQWSIEAGGALDLPAQELLIDPYVLGAWLGDGTSGAASIHCGDEDVDHLVEQVRAAGYHPTQRRAQTAWVVYIRPLPQRAWKGGDSIRARLRALGLLGNKHIPDIYLRAATSQRIALLQGLMDTDGSTLQHQAQCEFTSTNARLAQGVLELTRTLGLKPVLSEGRATLYGRDISAKYRVLFTTTDALRVFRLPRKHELCRARAHPVRRSIVSCQPVDSVPVRCIQVDSPSRLYLCGEAMVPTHNSTFVETIRSLLGDYGQQTPSETFLERRENAIPSDIARLRGARFVSAVETGEGRRVAEALLKRISGGDTMTARFLRQEWFEFMPQFKLWLATNHRPVIRGADEAIWRRIRLVPFEVTIPEADRDPTLIEHLRGEMPGILAWAARGCRAWLEQGLGTAQAVRDATLTYRAEMDTVGRYLGERCKEVDFPATKSSVLYRDYCAWLEEAGERPTRLSQTALTLRLRERGMVQVKKADGNYWALSLLSEEAERPTLATS